MALFLVVGVMIVASDASRLVCEYLCAEAVHHEHARGEVGGSASNSEDAFPLPDHVHYISSISSSTEMVVAASERHTDCGPIDSITVATSQQATLVATPSLNTTAVVVFGCGASNNTALTGATLFGSPPHSPPKVLLAAPISLRI